MSVDKFGHFSPDNSNAFKRDAPKVLGFFIDGNRNLDVQNKKIKNLDTPSEKTDAVNKIYVQTQLIILQEVLKKEIHDENLKIREEVVNLRKDIIDIYGILASLMYNHGEESNSK